MTAWTPGLWNGTDAAWKALAKPEGLPSDPPPHLDACGTQYRGCAPGCPFAEYDDEPECFECFERESIQRDGRLDTTFPVLQHDEEEARRIAAAINADTSTPFVAGVVGGEVKQSLSEPVSVRMVPDDEGLPSLGKDALFDDGVVIEDGVWRFWVDSDGYFDADTGAQPDVSTARHLIARHDRERGCYWADHLRALAGELEAEARRADEWAFDGGSKARTSRDAAHRILAILDELHEKGIC
jgi:hypothetical protein